MRRVHVFGVPILPHGDSRCSNIIPKHGGNLIGDQSCGSAIEAPSAVVPQTNDEGAKADRDGFDGS